MEYYTLHNLFSISTQSNYQQKFCNKISRCSCKHVPYLCGFRTSRDDKVTIDEISLNAYYVNETD